MHAILIIMTFKYHNMTILLKYCPALPMNRITYHNSYYHFSNSITYNKHMNIITHQVTQRLQHLQQQRLPGNCLLQLEASLSYREHTSKQQTAKRKQQSACRIVHKVNNIHMLLSSCSTSFFTAVVVLLASCTVKYSLHCNEPI